MCSAQHDGTCTAVLNRTHSDQLEVKLICECCGAVVELLGSIEHRFEPVLGSAAPPVSQVA